ncbi:hypothetical protein AB0D66_32560 [Streptomyces sp. NPDC048270]|uniref:hypothetical protein n=1 Tax=Streptomyces sp. NPDC048270 TaxID=3154615 RepID=UPI0033D53902
MGHGGLFTDGRTAPGMEIVAIPTGTTLQFYADSGQGLAYGEAQLAVWQQLRPRWEPLRAGNVTYNFCLAPLPPQDVPSEAHRNEWFPGHQFITPGDIGLAREVLLCNGSMETCPTDPRQVVEEGAVHQCTGLLGTYTGDLYWLACSSFLNADAAIQNATTADVSRSVTLGHDPDWTPGRADQQRLAAQNRSNVKKAPDDMDIRYRIGGTVVLIGNGHEPRLMTYAETQPDTFGGWVTVTSARNMKQDPRDASLQRRAAPETGPGRMGGRALLHQTRRLHASPPLTADDPCQPSDQTSPTRPTRYAMTATAAPALFQGSHLACGPGRTLTTSGPRTAARACTLLRWHPPHLPAASSAPAPAARCPRHHPFVEPCMTLRPESGAPGVAEFGGRRCRPVCGAL